MHRTWNLKEKLESSERKWFPLLFKSPSEPEAKGDVSSGGIMADQGMDDNSCQQRIKPLKPQRGMETVVSLLNAQDR